MTWRNTSDGFGVAAKGLHWLTVLLLIGSFGLGLSMVDMDLSPRKLQVYSWHKWVGITVLGLTVLRFGWRLLSPPPALPETVPPWQRVLAHLGHLGLYLLLVATPLAGWIMSSATGIPVVYLGLIPLPDLVAADRELAEQLIWVHGTLARLLAAFITLHILAALHHHFILKDDVLRRMLPHKGATGAKHD